MIGFWALILALAVNLALALVILTRANRSSATAYFGISALFIALWAFGTLMMLYSDVEAIARVGLLIFLISPMLTALYMVLFSKHFSEVDFPSKYASIGIGTGTLLVFAAITLFSAPSTDVITVSAQGTLEINLQHSWYWVYGSYFVAVFSISYLYLMRGVFRSKSRLHKQRRLVLIGIFATSFLALITNIILPLLGYTELLWMGPTWTIFYIVTTLYAMVKHGLFDLRAALVLTFTYGLSLAALSMVYYFLAYALSEFLVQSNSIEAFGALNVGLMLLLAFLFQPIRSFFDTLTNKIFYQDSYSIDEFFARLNKQITGTNDLHVLLHRAAETIGETLRAADISLAIYTAPDRIDQTGIGSYAKLSSKDLQWLDAYRGVTTSEPLVRSMLDDDDEQLRRMMVSHKIVVILPLVRQGVTMGYLFLGEHRRSGYSARDIRVIQTLADELVIAIQNALSVEEIKELNSNLEQRIDAATKELRKSNLQLQKLDEAKDEFISMASHQLRTPLTSIKGYLSMLMEGDVGKVSKDQRHILNEAFVSSERMVRLIGDFLNVSRLQTGKFVIDKRPVDLALLVQREIDGLEANAAARGVKFEYKKPKNIPTMELDENKIQQVVMNFADNAIYYSKDKSRITVTLKKLSDSIEFKVIDKGIGVPKIEQQHLFNKFFRATNARKARPDGTGVGLFLAKKVIDDHHGAIIFESKEGKGSTFGFRLPLAKNVSEKS